MIGVAYKGGDQAKRKGETCKVGRELDVCTDRAGRRRDRAKCSCYAI